MIEFSLYQIRYGTNGLEKFNVVNPDVVDVSDLEETLELDEAAFRVGNASVTVHGLDSDHFASAGNMMEPFVFQITENGGIIFHGVVVPDSVSWNAETNRTAFEVASWEYLLTEAGSLPARSIYEGDAIRSIATPGGAYIVFPEFVEIRTGDVIVLDAAEGERREVVTAVYNKGEVLWVDGRNVTVPVDEKWAAIITSTTSPALSGSPSGEIISRSAGALHQRWRVFTIRSMDLAMDIVERYGDSMRPQTTDNSKYADHIPFIPPRNAVFREFREIQLKYYTNDTERESFTLRNAIVFVSPDGTDYVEQVGSIAGLPHYGEIWVNLGVGPTPPAYDWWEYDRMEFIDRNPIHITEDINGKVKILGRDLYGYSGEWVNEPIYPLDHFKVTDIISALFTLDDIDPTTGYNRLGILPRIFRSVIDPNTTGHTIRREVELDNDPLGALRELQLASETLIRFHPVLDNGMPRLDVEIIPRSSIGGSAESGSDIIEWVENPVISPPQAVIVTGNNDYLTRKDDIEISGFWFETSSGLTPDTVTDEERRQFGLPTGDRVIEIEVPELPSGTMNSDNIYYGDGEAVYNDPKYKALARRYYEFYKKFTRTVEGTVAHRDPSLLGKYITFNEGKISESVLITQITSSLNEGELRTTIIGRIGDYTSPSASAPVAVIIGSHLFIDRTGAGAGVSVNLSGARSYDTDPGGLTYDWHYRSVGGSTWTYSGSGISFNELLVEGRYQVRLTVSNQVTGLSDTTIRNIEVETETPPVYSDPTEDGALTSLKHIEKFQSGVWGVVRWRPTWRELEQTSLGETRYRISVGGELPEIDWDAEPDHRVHYPVYPVLQGIDSKGIYRDFRVPLHHSHNSTLEIYVAVYGEDPIIMPFIFDRDTDADIHNFDLRLLANGNVYFSATPDEDTDYFEVWKSVDGGDFTKQGEYVDEVSNVQVHAGLPIGSVLTVQLRPYNPEGIPGNRQTRSVTNSFVGDHPDFTDVTLNGDIIFSGGGRISSAGQDALEVLSEDGSNHGELTVRVLRVIDHIDAIQTDILEVEDSYIKVNRGQTGTPSLNGGLIAERGTTDAYLEWDEGRDKWGHRLGDEGTFRAFVDESRSISTSNGITGGGDLSANRQLHLTGQALSLHLATGTGVFKRTSSGSIGVGLIVNDDITPNTIANNRLVSPHITLNAGAGIAAIGQIDLGGSSTIRLTGQALALHELSSNGLIARTGSGAVASRTIQGTANQVNVSNGNGVSGNPTLSLPQDVHTGAKPEFAGGIYTGDVAGQRGWIDRRIPWAATNEDVYLLIGPIDTSSPGSNLSGVFTGARDIQSGGAGVVQIRVAYRRISGSTSHRVSADILDSSILGNDVRLYDVMHEGERWIALSFTGISSHVSPNSMTFSGLAQNVEIRSVLGSEVTNAQPILGDGKYTLNAPMAQFLGQGRFADFLTLDKQATSTSHALRADRTLRIQGTSNRISVNNDSALNLTSNRSWQITAPQDLHTDSDFLVKTLRTKDWAGSTSFASGWTGHGWRAEDDHLEVTDLTVRNRLRVYELLIEQIRANNGSVAISNAAEVASVSGSTITLDEEVPVPFVVGDILRAQRFTGEGVYVSTIRVTSVGSGSFGFTLLDGDAPAEGMEYVRVGNTTDEDRQGLVYLTASDSGAPFIDILDGIDDHTKWNSSDVVRSRFGRLDGLTVPVGQLEGYGVYVGRGYIDKEVIIGGAGLSIDSFQQRPSALWHFDGSLVDTISGATPVGYTDATITDYGLVTGPGLTATLRKDGKFGGGVAVEVGTANLYPHPRYDVAPSPYGGIIIDVIDEPESLTGKAVRAVSMDHNTSAAARIGHSASVGHVEGTFSVYIKAANHISVGVDTRVYFGSDVGWVAATDVRLTDSYQRIEYPVSGVVTEMRVGIGSHWQHEGAGIVMHSPQLEAKPFATSFTEGTRAVGRLRLPIGSGQTSWTGYVRLTIPHAHDTGTVMPLWYFDGAGTGGQRSINYNYNGQISLRDGSAGWSATFGGVGFANVGDKVSVFVIADSSTVTATVFNHTTGDNATVTRNDTFPLGEVGVGTWASWVSGRITNNQYDSFAIFPYALSESEIRRIALSDAPIQERPSQVRITGEQILVGTDTLIRDGFIQSKYIAANSLTTEQLNFTPLLSADGTGDIIATINASNEGLRIAANKIQIDGTTTFSSGYDPSEKETPSGAQTKANAARDQAVSTASADATSKANAAENAAKSHANSVATAAEQAAIGHADSAISALEGSLGDLAFDDLVSAARLDDTIIDGAYIKTSLLDVQTILAQQASIGDWDIVSGNITSSGVTLNSSGYLDLASNAGVSGTGTSNSSVRFWAGDSYSSRASAAFNVRHDGTLNATKANITGTVNATDGSFTGTVNATNGSFTGTINATGGAIGGDVIIGQYDPVIGSLDNYRVYLGRSVLPLGGSQYASQPGLVITGNNPNQYATFGLRFTGSSVIPSMRLQRDADNRIILNDASALVRMSSGGNDVLTVNDSGLKVTGEINATTGSIGPDIRMGETVTYAANGIRIGEYGSLATTGHRGFISFGTSANQFVRVGLARPDPSVPPRPHVRIQNNANTFIEMASVRQFQYPMLRVVTNGQTIMRSTEVGMVLGGFDVGSSTIRGSGNRGAVQLTSNGRMTAWDTDNNLILDTGSGILRGANTYRVIDQSPNLKTYDSATWTDGFSTHFVPVEGDDYVVFAMRARMANASAVGRTRIIIQLLDGHSDVGDHEGGTIKSFASGLTDSALMFMTGYLEVAIPEAWRGRLCRVTHQIHRFQGTGQIQIREIVAMVASKTCYEQQFSNDWLGFTPQGTPPPIVTRTITLQKFGLANASPGTVTVSHSPANNGTTTTSFSGASTTKSFNNNDTITFTAPMHAEDTVTGLMLDFSHWVVNGQTYMGQSITLSITANTTIAMYFQRPGGDFRLE